MATVFERVRDITADKLSVDDGRDNRRVIIHRRP